VAGAERQATTAGRSPINCFLQAGKNNRDRITVAFVVYKATTKPICMASMTSAKRLLKHVMLTSG